MQDNKIYSATYGRVYGPWISDRAPALEGTVIRNPAYIIESLLRDECFTERDLEITTTATGYGSDLTCTGLQSTVDNYYVGARYHNITTGHSTNIIGYDGATKKLYLQSPDLSYAVGNDFYLSNIQGDNLIDSTSFDSVYGARLFWLFDVSITDKQDAQAILEKLCKEGFLILDRSQGKYKLSAMDSADRPYSLDNPLKANGRPKVYQSYSSKDNLYSAFRVKYGLDLASGEYKREYYVSAKTYTAGADLADHKTKCINAETNYRFKNRELEVKLDFVYDDNTALYFIKKLVNNHTTQKVIIEWYSSPKDAIEYTPGDTTGLDFEDLLQEGINNSKTFMVTQSQIIFNFGNPEIKLTLEQVI